MAMELAEAHETLLEYERWFRELADRMSRKKREGVWIYNVSRLSPSDEEKLFRLVDETDNTTTHLSHEFYERGLELPSTIFDCLILAKTRGVYEHIDEWRRRGRDYIVVEGRDEENAKASNCASALSQILGRTVDPRELEIHGKTVVEVLEKIKNVYRYLWEALEKIK